MKRPGRVHLWWHTVRYLRPIQVVSRARLRAQAALRRRAPELARRRYDRAAARQALRPSDRRWDVAGRLIGLAQPEEIAEARLRAEHAERGQFRFLNTTFELGRPVDWHRPGMAQLWQYKLQYSRYLVDIAATRQQAWPVVASLMREWIAGNPMGRVRDAWHPYVVSERLVSWMLAIRASAPASNAIGSDILDSLAVQAVFVENNLETDVGGNHLLKNLKAMAMAGCFWEGRTAERWCATYSDAFGVELNAQLLADGAHYERSPMYHAQVLEDALEVACALRAAGRPIPGSLASALRAMVAYLPLMVHPDGDIALFNDSVFGESPRPAALRAFASRVLDDIGEDAALTTRHAVMAAGLVGAPLQVEPGGTWTRDGVDGGLVTVPAVAVRGSAVVDVGPACPDDLPAHAHADLFSFELTLDSRRFLVDSGVGEYQAGPWRDYYRSTRAHNTVAVDGEEQIECWSSFRVARRARVFDRAAIDAPLVRGVTARHDGYRRLARPVDVRRTFVQLADRAWLVVDRLEGEGVHAWESFVHAAPDVRIRLVGDSHADLTRDGQQLTIAWFGMRQASVAIGVHEPLQGWYAPEFGLHLAAGVLVLSGSAALPIECGYLLAPGLEPSEVAVDQTGDGLDIGLQSTRYHARHAGGRITVDLVN